MMKLIRTSLICLLAASLLSCGHDTAWIDDATDGSTADAPTYYVEGSAESARLSTVEDDLLSLINYDRSQAGLPELQRDDALDVIMLWHVSQMATLQFLRHSDTDGRSGEERVQYYSGDDTVYCSEIIQWWSGRPVGETHYEGYRDSDQDHAAYMEEGIYDLGGAQYVGIAALEGNGPAGSSYEDTEGSYSGLVICNKSVTLETNPFE